MIEFHKLCKAAGLHHGNDYQQLLWVHDEVQVGVKKIHAQQVGELCVQAIENAGVAYKLNIPITGTYDLGDSWKDTH